MGTIKDHENEQATGYSIEFHQVIFSNNLGKDLTNDNPRTEQLS